MRSRTAGVMPSPLSRTVSRCHPAGGRRVIGPGGAANVAGSTSASTRMHGVQPADCFASFSSSVSRAFSSG
jgi:hypothetical protein